MRADGGRGKNAELKEKLAQFIQRWDTLDGDAHRFGLAHKGRRYLRERGLLKRA